MLSYKPAPIAVWAAASLVATSPVPAAAPDRGLPPGLVYLRDVAPTVIQDMRYASPRNFTGAVVPGYEAAECILTRATAAALAQVQADLAPRKLSLKVYDCYRPERAVRAFVRWTREPGEQTSFAPQYHPNVRRSALISLGYIAYASRHSRGDAIDLTLVELPEPAPPPGSLSAGDCTGPVDRRAPDTSVDMGTAFDCLDPRSATAHSSMTPEQRMWRTKLLEAMHKRGFRNYAREWWHFTYGEGSGPSYDVPVRARRE